jgi:DNA invertase Pin-like site-specific DNA recombinase
MKVDVSDDQSEDLEDSLARWLNEQSEVGAQPRARRQGGLRFAFYGRMSTVEYQDRVTSRHWQLDCASDLVSGHGAIVTEYFDVGCSRRRSWRRRPQSAALLAALGDPRRGFDAIVVGEYDRAFSGSQLLHLVPLLEQHGVQLWLPETDGPVDSHNPTHQALIMLLGAQSKREVQRFRFRVITAMRAQAREQGRYLGGRPPYGYRLIDAGPHPNAAHARWGRRLQRLEPDPATAAYVRWMFTQRLVARVGGVRVVGDVGGAAPVVAAGPVPDQPQELVGDVLGLGAMGDNPSLVAADGLRVLALDAVGEATAADDRRGAVANRGVEHPLVDDGLRGVQHRHLGAAGEQEEFQLVGHVSNGVPDQRSMGVLLRALRSAGTLKVVLCWGSRRRAMSGVMATICSVAAPSPCIGTNEPRR